MEFKLVLLLISAVFLNTDGQPRRLPIMSPAQSNEILAKCRERDSFTQPVVSVSTDCSLFAVCPRPSRLPTLQTCAPGTLFDENLRVCTFADRVDCSQLNTADPCNGQPDGFREDPIKSKPAQAAILLCSGGKTVGGRQCNVCEQFGGSNGCVFIPDCGIRTTPIPNDCTLEADQDNPRMYFQRGVRTLDHMNCANGTIYDAGVCGCVEGGGVGRAPSGEVPSGQPSRGQPAA